jgi:hypothetical protein
MTTSCSSCDVLLNTVALKLGAKLWGAEAKAGWIDAW